MANRAGIYIIGAVMLILGSSCGTTKHLGDGESLYVGSKVKIESSVPMDKSTRKSLTSDMKSLLRPMPNATLLGWRYKLWVYNLMGTPKKNKGIRYWIKNKIGEPPVLSNGASSEKNREILQNHLENKGYFFDTVLLSHTVKKKETTDNFTAKVGQPYTWRNIRYPAPTDSLTIQIAQYVKRSRIKPGKIYDLDVIKDERTRIDSRLKQKGFYYFSPDYLLLDCDTTVGNHQIDAVLRIIPSTPQKARNIYRLNEVVVFAAYDIHSDTSASAPFYYYDGYKILDTAHLFRPIVFSRTLVFKPGDVYNRDAHSLSLNRLITLGTYKFVKARFVETDTAGPNKLNAYYYLTPTLFKSIQLQTTALTRSDNSVGGQVQLSWKHRNFFHGAELFTFAVSGGLDQQYVGQGQKITTSTYGAEASLNIPRFIAPFRIETNRAYVPRTLIDASYNIFDRSGEYNLASTKVSFGYIFKETAIKEHQISMVVNLINPTHITPEFADSLKRNVTLARSIERQFIIGPEYNFNINTLARPGRRKNDFYFNANVDLSGNLLGWITGADIAKGKVEEIFGVPFSQYGRISVDFRHYLSLSRMNRDLKFISRFSGGIGYAYGNSSTMPFSKEFFAGGTNDIRAFRSNMLGPGTYNQPYTPGSLLIEQPGDIKLEINEELRFPIFSYLKGALFVDAGNVWTRQADTSRPGSQFSKNFLSQTAVGVGFGLRVDVQIIVLRLDLGLPVREPWQTPGNRWTFSNVGDISKSVINFAIGYPF